MPKDAKFKKEVRAYAADHDLAYTDARRRILEARESTAAARQATTVVPAGYFDSLVADLDAPDEPNDRVAAAHRRLRETVTTGRQP